MTTHDTTATLDFTPSSSYQYLFAQGSLEKMKTLLILWVLSGILCLIQTTLPGIAQATPTLSLFPSTVVENIRETAQTSQNMENSLHPVIRDLETQMALYTDAHCDENEMDEGCRSMSTEIGDKYLKMLSLMEENLPNMEYSINQTNKSLGKNLKKQLGLNMTPRQLQTSILQSKTSVKTSTGRKHRSMRFSQKFKQYYDLVAMGGRSNGGGSLAEVASSIYLDTKEVGDLISMTKDEISRAKLMVELNNVFGLVTPEMTQVISGVKSVLFGEVAGNPSIPDPLPSLENGYFISPLQM